MTKTANLVQPRVNWRSLLLVAVAILALGAIACGSDDPEPTAVPPAAAAPVTQAPTAAPTASDAMDAMDAMMDDHSEDLMMAQAEASIIVPLDPLNDSGQWGVAILLDKGTKTEVVVDLAPGAADVPQPIHIHDGTCDARGAVGSDARGAAE